MALIQEDIHTCANDCIKFAHSRARVIRVKIVFVLSDQIRIFLYKSPSAGGPRAASEERLGRASKEAAKSSSASKARNPSGFAARLLGSTIADPDSMDDSEDESGSLELWRLLPQLKELPEALLRKLPVSTMFQLNTALAKEKKTSC